MNTLYWRALRASSLSAALVAGLFMVSCSSSDDAAATGTPDTGGLPDTADGSDSTDGTDATDGTDGGDGDVVESPDVPANPDTGQGPDAEADTFVPPTIPDCSTDSPAALGACIDSTKLQADLTTIAQARVAGTPHHKVVQDLCADRLTALGYTVERQNYGTGTNVVGRLTGTSQPEQLVVLGAHYDGQPECNGADDNASGVAGTLEAARVLASTSHARTLVVACWDEEELALVGSRNWVRQAVRAAERVVVNFNFEMIGYYSDAPNSQTLPAGFNLLFDAAAKAVAANGNRGDFIALVGDESAKAHVAHLEAYGAQFGMPTINATVGTAMLDAAPIAPLRRSDHAAFWDERIPAIMLTDTADYRNPNYHCGGGGDDLSTVDVARAAKVVSATVAATADALAAGQPSEGSTGRPVECSATGGCNDGQKCSIGSNAVGKWTEMCVPLAETPAAKGGDCVRPNGVIGEDDCAAGLFCAFWGVPKSSPQKRHCLGLCSAAADCDAGEVCVYPDNSSIRGGLCMKECDPFGTDCGEGLACRYWGPRVEDGASNTTCLFEGTVPEGGGCEPDLDGDCQKGLTCVLSTSTGAAECRAFCDAEHPCGAGRQCVPDRSTSIRPGLGFCQP